MSGRREERIEAALAVLLESGSGVTRNVSASGVYFETEAPLAEGAPLRFSLRFDDQPGGPLILRCEARIVRLEERDGKFGVGAEITSSSFERPGTRLEEPA